MVTPRSTNAQWLTLCAPDPHSEAWLHSGIAVLDERRVVYETVGGGAIVIHDVLAEASSRVSLPIAHAHGITVTGRGSATRIWIADPGPRGGCGQVLELSADGEVLSLIEAPPSGPVETWRPTAVVVQEDGTERKTLWIADGYGHNRLYRLSQDGTSQSWDSAADVPFDCPHGLAIDTRSPAHRIVVADRGNRRLVFLRTDGSVDRVVSDERMTSPSCIAVQGDQLIVTDLYGTILTVAHDDRVAVRLGDISGSTRSGWPNREVDGAVVAPLLQDGELNSPHGVAATEAGEIFLTDWVFGGRVVRLQLPEADTAQGNGRTEAQKELS